MQCVYGPPPLPPYDPVLDESIRRINASMREEPPPKEPGLESSPGIVAWEDDDA